MKSLFYWLALSASVLLAGCANTASTRTDATASSVFGAAESGGASDGNPALYPAGGLKPLASRQLGSQSVHALLPPVDLWERVRRGFAMPDLDTDLVRERELWYSSRPDSVARMTERGSKYLFYIVE